MSGLFPILTISLILGGTNDNDGSPAPEKPANISQASVRFVVQQEDEPAPPAAPAQPDDAAVSSPSDLPVASPDTASAEPTADSAPPPPPTGNEWADGSTADGIVGAPCHVPTVSCGVPACRPTSCCQPRRHRHCRGRR